MGTIYFHSLLDQSLGLSIQEDYFKDEYELSKAAKEYLSRGSEDDCVYVVSIEYANANNYEYVSMLITRDSDEVLSFIEHSSELLHDPEGVFIYECESYEAALDLCREFTKTSSLSGNQKQA